LKPEGAALIKVSQGPGSRSLWRQRDVSSPRWSCASLPPPAPAALSYICWRASIQWC